MKAVVVESFGGPDELRLAEVADPVPGPDQVRVRVHAAGVNPVDAGNRADGSWAGLRAPCVLGYDFAGVVESLGPGVAGFSIGDRVMGMTHFPDGAGAYAELVVANTAQVARISAATSFVDAAATPLAGGTALEVLTRLALPAGSRLLVLGASGGVGMFLLQLARLRGVETIAVGSEPRHEQLRTLGASACIDYRHQDVARRAVELAGGPVDGIADLVGGLSLAHALSAIRSGGRVAAIETPEIDLDRFLDANLTFEGVLLQDDGRRTGQLASLLADHSIRPVVGRTFSLADAAASHRLLEERHAGGKIVLNVIE